MKNTGIRMAAALLSGLMLIGIAGCGSTDAEGSSAAQSIALEGDAAQTIELNSVPYVLDTTEYALYQNIFYNDMADDYTGKEVTKTGVFTVLEDRYNDRTRYYVWGYNDETKCCDWQWEIEPDDTSELPENGSQVEVKGTFTESSDALDGYWITDPTIEVKEEYSQPDCDINMTAMSATLESVQIANILNYSDDFEGKTVCAFGRVASDSSIQHPYYDDYWSLEFESEDSVPATGTVVVLTGTLENGVLTDAHISETDMF